MLTKANSSALTFPVAEAPQTGQIVEIAPGICGPHPAAVRLITSTSS